MPQLLQASCWGLIEHNLFCNNPTGNSIYKQTKITQTNRQLLSYLLWNQSSYENVFHLPAHFHAIIKLIFVSRFLRKDRLKVTKDLCVTHNEGMENSCVILEKQPNGIRYARIYHKKNINSSRRYMWCIIFFVKIHVQMGWQPLFATILHITVTLPPRILSGFSQDPLAMTVCCYSWHTD